MTPVKIQNVISKTKEDYTTNGQEGTDELSKLEAEERERGEMYMAVCIRMWYWLSERMYIIYLVVSHWSVCSLRSILAI